MRIILIVGVLLVVAVIAIVAIGAALPVHHRATRRATFATTPERLQQILVDVTDYPSWRSGVTRVDLIDRTGAVTRFREMSRDGAIEYLLDAHGGPSLLISRIVGGVTAFGGEWEYRLGDTGGGTTLEITENGDVYNPFFRFVSRFIMGHTATIDRYLADLTRRVARKG